jgi:hypothetical protein
MRYSLLNRFQGALLGAALGEISGSQQLGQSLILAPKIDLEVVRTQIAVKGFESLIRQGRLDLKDWVAHLPPSAKLEALTVSETAIITLPIALFSHDNLVTLREQLTLASSTFRQGAFLDSYGEFVMGYAIAQALTEKLNPQTLIAQILNYLQDSDHPLLQQLVQVQTLLEQRASLTTAVTHLCHNSDSQEIAIALAFYCFLSTPEDFRLSITRATRTGYQPQITSALTGILSGVYNSLIGIPLAWRLAFDNQDQTKMLPLASRLVAVWSGAYHPATSLQEYHQMAVAAPRVIQPR